MKRREVRFDCDANIDRVNKDKVEKILGKTLDWQEYREHVYNEGQKRINGQYKRLENKNKG